MDKYSSGEELVIKPRKPYTITKQRERWTEEEHHRFLEALKLYGRAWQRIEEHIGTKTAVQIRSHGQKFFSKLEKEALDINIPPPRPKRKPSNPYPRKTGTAVSACQLGAKGEKPAVLSTSCGNEELDLEKEPLSESSIGVKRPSTTRDNHDRCPAEAVPLLQEITQENDTSDASNLTSSCVMHEKPVAQEKDCSDSVSPPTEMQGIQNHPQDIPVHFVDRNVPICGQVIHPGMQIQNPIFHPLGGVQSEHLNLNADPAVSITSEHQNNSPRPANQTFSTFHPPYTLFCPNLEEYQSLLLASSTFSSLIVSTLLQNPAAYSAASFAASFFPYANKGSSADFPKCDQESFQPKQGVSTPSMAAIAAATVVAATAWWVANGLLPPVCTPLHSLFPCPPVSTCPTQPMDSSQVQGDKEHGKHDAVQNPPTNDQQIDPQQSACFEAQHSPSKSQTSSSLELDESGDLKLHDASKTIDCDNVAAENEFHDANKSKGKKQVDRSSCGSNTASSSDVETDAFKKNERVDEVPEEVDNNPTNESSCRRSKNTSIMSDSWKEVSEEGRLAFQALFAREVLPQSFSPQHIHKNMDHDNENGDVDKQTQGNKSGDEMTLDLNSRTGGPSPYNLGSENHALTGGKANCNDCLLTLGLGHGRLKGRRTGFKPYKRCSVEARENRAASIGGQDEEKGSKKIRLEGEAST